DLIQEAGFKKAVHERGRTERTIEREAKCLALPGLHEKARAGRDDRLLEHVELIDARADDPPEVLRQEDGVLHVGAALVATRPARREREIEIVVPEVAA